MEQYIDLHTHSTASDGTDSPEILIENAKKAHLSAIALTDHDTLNGLEQAEKKAKEIEIELIKGIEFSTDYARGEVHILGYWFHSDPTDNPNFNKALEKVRDYRSIRNEELFKKLSTVGVHLSVEEVAEFSENGMLCRPHFAQAMLKRGYVKDIKQAFARYLGYDGSAYIPKNKLSQRDAIEILRDSQAVVSFAHPFLTICKDEKERKALIKQLADYGLHAIETYYSINSQDQTQKTISYAKEFNLHLTGGSDYHGTVKPNIKLGVGKGGLRIPYCLLNPLKEIKN